MRWIVNVNDGRLSPSGGHEGRKATEQHLPGGRHCRGDKLTFTHITLHIIYDTHTHTTYTHTHVHTRTHTDTRTHTHKHTHTHTHTHTHRHTYTHTLTHTYTH